MKVIPYASAIGSINYAMLCTRPDVCLAISLAGRYQSNPGVDHWTAVKNILKYLKRTKDMFLIYGGDKELIVNGYVDARKYALEAIIKLLFISLYHDKCLLFMLELYYPET